MLYPSLELLPGETPASFVSRLAMLHRARSARLFSLDMGFQFQAIVDGHQDALTKLAHLTGRPVETLFTSTIRRAGASYTLHGQEIVRTSLRRTRTVICPRCTAEDLGSQPEPWLAGGRLTWLLEPIRTCERHHVALLQVVAAVKRPALLHDFARNLALVLPSIPRLAEEAESSRPTALESYLLDRIAGKSGLEWLDALPWHAAARISEMIGAVAEFGRLARTSTFGNEEWRRSGEAGFRIAADGPEGIRALLDHMRREYPARRIDNTGPQAWFGRLHTWLTHTQRDPVYDPLRDVILEFIRDTVPVAPGHEFFGRQVIERRRLHSIRTASLETGLHPKRLRRMLALAGLIPDNHQQVSDDRVVFDADKATEFLAKAKRAINHLDAASYLNAGRVQTALLMKHQFIRPFLSSKQGGLHNHAYDREELDTFIESLLAGSVLVTVPKPPVFSIPQAAKRANCTAAEIVRLILDRKLAWVGRKVDGRGYASVLVDSDEIRHLVRGDHGDDLTLSVVQATLRTGSLVLDALVKQRILPTKRAISPLNRCPYQAVPRAALEGFMAEYGSLWEIARERGLHFLKLKKRLQARGIEPAFDRKLIHASFYRRCDLPDEF